ncbi:SDR family NAD(P)-dependent oxidoreductase [Gordonia polyisoprenivorans]|nr:SDR family NAD(P)-dependent oxidoreductase [Gordonia polyisoprenivorans]
MVVVVVAARTEAVGGRFEGSIHEVEQLIREAGGSAVAVARDVADPDSCAELVEAARTAFSPVDILVNNAALTVPDRQLGPKKDGPRLSVAEALPIVNFPWTLIGAPSRSICSASTGRSSWWPLT